jgi:hypothetical protein
MSNVTQTGAVGEVVVTQTGQESAVTVVTARGPAGPSGPAGPTIVDQTIIDGSANAVAGNAVFDALALKAPIANPTFTGIVTAPRITGRCDGMEVLCKAGLAISAGQVVYVTGASGNNIIIGLAQANAELTSSKTIGISESTLANNGNGYVITEGLMTVSISAPTAAEGDPIWLSPTTAGGMVFGAANKPVAPNHMVYLGVVTRKTGNTIVEIFVKIQNGSELDELADVSITSPTAGQALMRGASLWSNRSLVSADISDATNAGTPNTIVKRGTEGGAAFAGTNFFALSASTTTATAVSAVSTNGIGVYGESGSSDGGFFGSVFGNGLTAYSTDGDYHAKFGGSSGNNRSFVARVSGAFGWWRGAFRGFLQAPASITSSDKTWTLPNNTGTVALTTDEMTPTAAGIAAKINGATSKSTPVDADEIPIADSAASFGLKKVTWANVFAYIQTKLEAAANIVFTGQLRSTNQTAATADALMTRSLSDTRYTRTFEVIQETAETSAANTTTYADSTQCALALEVGTYIIETWQEVEGLGSTGSAKTRLRWTGTATASGHRFLAGGSTSQYLQNADPVVAQNGARIYSSEVLFNYGSNRGGVVSVRFKFVVTVAGTMYIQYAPAVNPGTGQTAQINVGSFIVARQIA